jgi:hypothetical protein
MNKLLASLIAGAFAATSAVAVAQTAAPVTPAAAPAKAAAPAATPAAAPAAKPSVNTPEAQKAMTEASKGTPKGKFSTSSEAQPKKATKQTKEQAAERERIMQSRSSGDPAYQNKPAIDKNAPKPATKDMNPKNAPVQPIPGVTK